MKGPWSPTWALTLILASSITHSWAADDMAPALGTRDPTQMPGTTRPSSAWSGAAEDATAETPPQPFFIMSDGDRLSVIHNAHRLHVGDELGNARIARIDTDAVWLRANGQVKKITLYPGVGKRPPTQATPAPQRHRRSPATKKDAP